MYLTKDNSKTSCCNHKANRYKTPKANFYFVKIFHTMPKKKPENATIEVILLETDKHLGEKYEKVRVKPIFARNVLLPKAKAVLATPMNINNYKQKMESAMKEIAKKATDMKDLFSKIQEND